MHTDKLYDANEKRCVGFFDPRPLSRSPKILRFEIFGKKSEHIFFETEICFAKKTKNSIFLPIFREKIDFVKDFLCKNFRPEKICLKNIVFFLLIFFQIDVISSDLNEFLI